MSQASTLCESLLEKTVVPGNFTLKELVGTYGLQPLVQKCRSAFSYAPVSQGAPPPYKPKHPAVFIASWSEPRLKAIEKHRNRQQDFLLCSALKMRDSGTI